jgi:nucleoside-diphosphate-sugar epimerase
MASDTLVVGPGWLGAPAAIFLAARTEPEHGRVFCLSRSAQSAPAGCQAVAGDITVGALDARWMDVIQPHITRMVICVAPSSSRGDSYAIYPAAARGAAALAATLNVTSVVYISSTGIYDRQDGSDVDERTLIAPATARVQALMEAELAILATASPTRPGRDPGARFAQGSTDPDTWCNFSWRDDVVAAIAHVLQRPATGKGELFNCTDNTPVQAGLITQALTGRAAAVSAPADDTERAAAPYAALPVRAGRSNQRISSELLLATGWTPTMPNVFAGLRALGHALPGLEERA